MSIFKLVLLSNILVKRIFLTRDHKLISLVSFAITLLENFFMGLNTLQVIFYPTITSLEYALYC
jgi:hypothetical protein